ncbi:ferredoxin [Nocardioides sp. NPDC051685]|uniref:ferredoxin n=1 Tax=Nocardioides sp. NPDC051685 TaxID=3364334 RepID=UPI0037B7CFCA
MKVLVDRSKCVSLGVCETVSPAFELDESSELLIHEEQISEDSADLINEAVQSCPVKALKAIG